MLGDDDGGQVSFNVELAEHWLRFCDYLVINAVLHWVLGPAAAVATAGVLHGITTWAPTSGWCARVKLLFDQCLLHCCCEVHRSASCIIAGKVSHSAIAAIRFAGLVGICQKRPTSLATPHTRGIRKRLTVDPDMAETLADKAGCWTVMDRLSVQSI